MEMKDVIQVENFIIQKSGIGPIRLDANASFKLLNEHPEMGIRTSVALAHFKVKMKNLLNSPQAILEFELVHAGVTYKIDKFIKEREYFVTEDLWFAIDPAENQELNDLFNECGIDFQDSLTISQALHVSVQSARLSCDFVNSWTMTEFPQQDLTDHSSLVRVEPFNYQSVGFTWLRSLREIQVGGILGDEMGLGKTLQAIMLFESEIRNGRTPNLLVCPPSLTENWRREIAKFIGRLAYTHQGADRLFDVELLKKREIVIVSYDTLRRDRQMFSQINWNVIAADEAQYIKNPASERSVSIKMLPKKMGLAITGTPIETSLRDIWSISDFTIPGVLGDQGWFKSAFEDDLDGANRIRALVKPLILRRRVMEVARDLPNVIKLEVPIILSPTLLNDYREVKNQNISGMGEALRIAGELRQLCCHIQRLDAKKEVVDISGKFEYLNDTLPQLFSDGLKSIVFSPYTITTEFLAEWLKEKFGEIFVGKIYGATRDKQHIVDEFTKSISPGVLVINPKAGGVGLNITAANHVFHFAPDWNPAVLDQANARAYRRGQDRPVTIHNLFYSETIEERMIERVNMRRALSETALLGTDVGPTFEELRAAIERDPGN
jgi:SNF2 family DNA or RNA helicase